MLVVRAIVTAFSFFSAIPMPYLEWDDANMRYMMAAFPLVGLVIGALWWLWGQASFAASFGAMLRGVGFALVPVLVTGGIHLDGMADVIDAQSSHASPVASELNAAQLPALACIPIVSRCLSGLVTVTLRTSKSEGMLAAEQASADARVVRLVLACAWVAATACLLVTAPAAALLATVASWAVVASVWHLAKTQFGGMSGDLAGYLLQMVELAMLAALVVNGRLWWS